MMKQSGTAPSREAVPLFERVVGLLIRPMEQLDLEPVLSLWLAANEQAHGFVPPGYWRGQLDAVRAALPQAAVYVSVGESGVIEGFIGLTDGYIAGLFVDGASRGRGVGKRLVDCAKRLSARLTLTVYQKNEAAVRFYRREGFVLVSEQIDAHTGENEWHMVWPAP